MHRISSRNDWPSMDIPRASSHQDYGSMRVASRPTIFTLVVDNFAIKYLNDEDAHHLINAVKKNYVCSVDCKAKQYCGVAFKWDYNSRIQRVHLTMPHAVQKAQTRFQHVTQSNHNTSHTHTSKSFTVPKRNMKQVQKYHQNSTKPEPNSSRR